MDGEEGLPAAPVEFKRMLSWQLSAPTVAPVKNKKRKKKEVTQPGVQESESLGDEDYVCSDDEELGFTAVIGESADYAYVYVNSDGEEEVYYSAPESPLTSEDAATTSQGIFCSHFKLTIILSCISI